MKIPEPWLRNTYPGCAGASDLSGHQTCHTVEQRAELPNTRPYWEGCAPEKVRDHTFHS